MSTDDMPIDNMPTKETPERNLFVTVGLPLILVFMCAVCGVLVYFFVPIFPEDEVVEKVTETVEVVNSVPAGPTATSILDEAFTSDVNEAVPDEISTPTPESVANPDSASASASDSSSVSGPASASAAGITSDLPASAASDYATLLVLEGSVFILEQAAKGAQTDKINQAEANKILKAIEQIFIVVGEALAQPLPYADTTLAAAKTQAKNVFTAVDELIRGWQENEISPEEVAAALIPVREQVDEALTLAERSFNQQYGLEFDTVRQARIDAVRVELINSVANTVESEAGAPDLSPPVPIQFSGTDLPLSDTLRPAIAGVYVARILEVINNFSNTQTTLTELIAQRPKEFVQDPRNQKIALGIVTIQASSRIIKDIELPTNLAPIRQALLIALLDCDTAALYLESGFDTPPDFEIGLKFLESCNEKLAGPTQELQAFSAGKPTQVSTSPSELVVAACPAGCKTLQPGCIIKGDITESGIKAYHLPGSVLYGRTQINPDKGERWFCAVQEAKANGWLSAGSS